MKTCNHCPGELVSHDGMRHCPECGCYFVGRHGELAPDHTPCREALRAQVAIAGQEWAPEGDPVATIETIAPEPEPEPIPEPEPTAPDPEPKPEPATTKGKK